MDHGYARFNHVRIPREHMLSKFAEVTADGRYIQPPHAKMSYGGVSNARYFRIAPKLKVSAQMLYLRSG